MHYKRVVQKFKLGLFRITRQKPCNGLVPKASLVIFLYLSIKIFRLGYLGLHFSEFLLVDLCSPPDGIFWHRFGHPLS